MHNRHYNTWWVDKRGGHWSLAAGARAGVQVPRHSGLGGSAVGKPKKTDNYSDPQALRGTLGFPEKSRAVTGD